MAKAPAKTAGKKKAYKKREKRNVPLGIVHVQATFNNTIITFTDPLGNVIAWSSSGSLGFRGSRKGTPYAAQQAALTAANKAKEVGMRTVTVHVSGPGAGRESGAGINFPTPGRVTEPRPQGSGRVLQSRDREGAVFGKQDEGASRRKLHLGTRSRRPIWLDIAVPFAGCAGERA